MRQKHKWIYLPGILGVLFYSNASLASFAIQEIRGVCTIADKSQVITLSAEDNISPQHLIACNNNSTAQLIADDGTTILITPNTVINLISYSNDKETENALSTITLLQGAVKIQHQQPSNYDIFYKFVTATGSIDYYGNTLLIRQCNSDCNEIYPTPINAVYMYTDSEDTVFRNYKGGLTLDKSSYLTATSARTVPSSNHQAEIVLKQTYR